MNIYLLRHGRTRWNAEHRYQGRSDIPLSAEGEAELCRAELTTDEVWVSPLCRARRTAELLFPESRQNVVEAFAEMDFGDFEGRNYLEMEHDPAYRAWVDGGCNGRCPGGESRQEFSRRVCGAFEALVEQAARQGRQELVIVAHGGVQMAVMERFAQPEREYFRWQSPPGGGYVLAWEEPLWRSSRKLRLLKEVQYTKGGVSC